MSNSPKAIFFDIDGTLIAKGRGPFREDLKAMKEARREGHRLFLNTGRSFANIPPVVLRLPLWSGVVAGCAHVLLAGPAVWGKPGYETIYHKWVDNNLLQVICAWYLEHGKCLILEGEKECYMVNPSARSFTVRRARLIKNRDDFITRYAGDFITKLTMETPLSGAERELLEDHFQINVFADYAEGIIKGETKASSMKLILEAIGVKREDSIALGDSVNDLDMIGFAGLGIAMGNACAELKATAGTVTGNCGEGGVGEALRRFVLLTPPG